MNPEEQYKAGHFETEHGTNGGLTVPEGYFNDLPGRILDRMGTSGFTAPDDSYFAELTGRTMKATAERPKTIRLPSGRRWWAAAAVLLVASGLWWFGSQQPVPHSAIALHNVNEDDIIRYLQNADLRDMDVELTLSNEDKTQLQVEEYLINNTDEQSIIDAL